MQEQEPTKLERKLDRIDRKYLRKNSWHNRKFFAGVMGFTAFFAADSIYWADVIHNIQEEQNSSFSIDEISEAKKPENSHYAFLFLNGFNTKDANDVVRSMTGPVRKLTDGATWSGIYADKGLDSKHIAEVAIQEATSEGVDTLIIVGYSGGAVTAAEVNRYIVESDSNIQVAGEVLISGPSDYDGLRPERQEEIDIAKTLKIIPGIEHSGLARIFIQIYFERNDGNPFEVVWHVLQEALAGKLTVTALVASEMFSITDANYKEQFEHIVAASTKKQMPVIIYLGTKPPSYDYIVNDKYSGPEIIDDATSVGLSGYIDYVSGAVHTQPEKGHKGYMETMQKIAQVAIPQIEANQEFYEFMNVRIVTKVQGR